MNNINQIFNNNARLYKDRPLFWYKNDSKWTYISWNNALKEIKLLCNILKSYEIKKNDKVAIISPNSPQWCIADLSIMNLGAITVPGYITSNENEILYLLNHSECQAAFVSFDILTKIKKIRHKLKFLKFLICFDEHKMKLEKLSIFTYKDLLKTSTNFYKKKSDYNSKVNKNDLACIIYTSGTSANPKGVMLTHGSIIENMMGAKIFLDEIEIKKHKFLSILPLSHAYEHTGGFLLPILIGAEIFFSNNREQLINDFQFVKPTLMVAVPRLYDVLYKRILNNVNSKGKILTTLFNMALKIGKQKYEQQKLTLFEKIVDPILDIVIRKKIKKVFGNNLMAFISGGASLNYNSGIFFTSLGIKILQGYGQTECSPIISVNPINKIKMKTVGIPIINHKVKISKTNEILVKGPSVMKGYWKDSNSTKKTIKGGWLHTGDLGKIDEENYITIIGRKNEMIVNSGGENISPVPIEELITTSDEIDQAMIYGHQKPYLIALVYPSYVNDINKEDIKKRIAKFFVKFNSKLSAEKKVRKFYLLNKPFSIENSELTPTLKLKRKVIENNYKKQIMNLYK